MVLSKQEFDEIIADETKMIVEDIRWEGPSGAEARAFRVDVQSGEGHPIFVKGWYNPPAGKLSYSIVHRVEGRIYGLDMGAEDINPDGRPVGEKHKNYWVPGSRARWAYVPPDITEPFDRPVDVWHQFCDEAKLTHFGTMVEPAVQRGLSL